MDIGVDALQQRDAGADGECYVFHHQACSRVKTEMAEDVAELQQLFDSVEASNTSART